MRQLLLIIGASLRTRLRWLRRHVYAWLVLGPLILGMTYATAGRMAEVADLNQLSAPAAWLLASALTLCLAGLSLSRAVTEIYHVRQPEAYFESLPVPAAAHLGAGLAARLGRTGVAALVIIAARSLFAGLAPVGWRAVVPLVLFVAVTALAEVVAALHWIHWGHTRRKAAAALAVLVVVAAAGVAGGLLALALLPDRLPVWGRLWLLPAAVALSAGLFGLAYLQHARWRASDVEYARRLQAAGRWGVFGLRPLSRLGPAVAAQLARDLQLTLRAFSSAVYVVAALALLWVVALVAALTSGALPSGLVLSGWLDAAWLPPVMAVKIVCALVTVTLAALAPVLVAYELPHLWLERAVGVTGLDLWQAKLWYARLVSLPAPLLAWFTGGIFGGVPAFYLAPMLAECLLIWWLVGSLFGAFSYEMPERPGLSIILMATLGLAAGIISAMLWFAGFVMHVQAMHSLTARGRERARYYLITGEE